MVEIPLTLPLSQAAQDRLQLLAAAYNEANGTALTLAQWVTLHLRELAINAEWSDSVVAIQRQLEIDAQAAVRAERERLIATV